MPRSPVSSGESAWRFPQVFGHDPEKGLLLMEDLGDEDLFTYRNAPWDLRRRLYEKTLTMVSRLHAFPPGRFPSGDIRLMPAFGPELYRWERDYFREHCVMKTCGIRLTGRGRGGAGDGAGGPRPTPPGDAPGARSSGSPVPKRDDPER